MNIKNTELSTMPDRLDYAFKRTKEKIDPDNEMTVKDAYKFLTLSQSTFSAYRKGTEPSSSVLKKLSGPCGFNMHWIVTGQGPMYVTNVFSVDEGESKLSQVPHVSDVTKSIVLDPTLVAPLEIHEHLRFDKVVNSDSPEGINIGSIVLVDSSITQGEGIFLLEANGRRTIRELQINLDKDYVLTDKHGTSEITSPGDIKILGSIAWSAGRI